MKKGTKIIAIDPCVMKGTGLPTLTVGKEYEVFKANHLRIVVIDDTGGFHTYYLDTIDQYFQTINEEALLAIGFKRRDWKHAGEDFHEWRLTNTSVPFWLEVTQEMKATLLFNSEYDYLPNCRTLTDLKHLIRILGI